MGTLNINGLVLLGKSEAETINFPIEYGAFLHMLRYTGPLKIAGWWMFRLLGTYILPEGEGLQNMIDPGSTYLSQMAGQFPICVTISWLYGSQGVDSLSR